jgi:thiol-disulfide isomerase/thioredoxin
MNRNAAIAAAVLLVPAAAVVGVKMRTPHVSAAYSGTPEVIAASFVSAWCASCKILEPRLARVMPSFSDAPVKFEELDFTFGATPELAERAAVDGYGVVYSRYAGATGFTLLIDRESGEVLDKLTMSDTEQTIRARIDAALRKAGVTRG